MSYNLFFNKDGQTSAVGTVDDYCLAIHSDREPEVEILKDNLDSLYAFEEVIF